MKWFSEFERMINFYYVNCVTVIFLKDIIMLIVCHSIEINSNDKIYELVSTIYFLKNNNKSTIDLYSNNEFKIVSKIKLLTLAHFSKIVITS